MGIGYSPTQQWRAQDFIKGGVLQFVPGRHGVPPLKKSLSGGGGGGRGVRFPRFGVRVPSYITNLSDKQTSNNKKLELMGGGGVWTPNTPFVHA